MTVRLSPQDLDRLENERLDREAVRPVGTRKKTQELCVVCEDRAAEFWIDGFDGPLAVCWKCRRDHEHDRKAWGPFA